MPRFSYKAKNIDGKEESGVLSAENSVSLAKILRRKGYFLLDHKEVGVEIKTINNLAFLNKFFKVPLSEKIFFTNNLEVMIKTGVPLPRSFDILSRQTKNDKFRDILTEISQKIMKGQSLSSSLSNFPDTFSSMFIETIKVGEETGRMDESLSVLSDQMEREHNLKSKITGAMVYPIVVLVLAVIIGIVMFIFAIPNMKDAFVQMEIDLPITTQIMFSFSDFVTERWLLSSVILGVLIFLIVSFFKNQKGGKLLSAVAIKTPVFSKIVKNINSALTLRTLSSLLSAGVPVVRSLNITSGALGNHYFKEALKEAAIVIEKGSRISEALKKYDNLYSPMVIEMMEVGEETGETSSVLVKLADFYEKEVISSTEKLSSIIEPMLIVLVGGMVGFFAISMMQPMFSITKGL